MFHFLIFIFLLIIIIPLIFLGGIISTIWRTIKGKNSGFFNQHTYNQGQQSSGRRQQYSGNSQRSSGNSQQYSERSQSSSGNSQRSSGRNQGKIFSKNQGEYVDFEEVE